MFRHQIRTVLYCTVLYCTVLYCTVLCLPVLAAGAGREVDAAEDGDDELLPLPVVPGLHLQPAALNIVLVESFRYFQGATCPTRFLGGDLELDIPAGSRWCRPGHGGHRRLSCVVIS